MQDTQTQWPKVILDCFNEAVRKAAEEEFDLAKKRLDARKDEIIAGISLQVMKRVEMNTLSDRLVINIFTEPIK